MTFGLSTHFHFNFSLFHSGSRSLFTTLGFCRLSGTNSLRFKRGTRLRFCFGLSLEFGDFLFQRCALFGDGTRLFLGSQCIQLGLTDCFQCSLRLTFRLSHLQSAQPVRLFCQYGLRRHTISSRKIQLFRITGGFDDGHCLRRNQSGSLDNSGLILNVSTTRQLDQHVIQHRSQAR